MNIITELYNQYFAIAYEIGTGSDNWRDIKTDFELLDNDIIGFVSILESNGLVPGSLDSHLSYSNQALDNLKMKLEVYKPLSKEEFSEKELLIKKFNLLHKIYKLSIERSALRS